MTMTALAKSVKSNALWDSHNLQGMQHYFRENDSISLMDGY